MPGISLTPGLRVLVTAGASGIGRAIADLLIENGARLAWLIDPMEKQVVLYRPNEATETLEAPDVVRGHAPVEGFELDMQPIWEL